MDWTDELLQIATKALGWTEDEQGCWHNGDLFTWLPLSEILADVNLITLEHANAAVAEWAGKLSYRRYEYLSSLLQPKGLTPGMGNGWAACMWIASQASAEEKLYALAVTIRDTKEG